MSWPICPLCNRPIDPNCVSEHHLIPKCKKGKEKVQLHAICHNKIHSLFDENELASYYNTIQHLLENDAIQKFVKWVYKKPINYIDRSIMSNQHKWKKRNS